MHVMCIHSNNFESRTAWSIKNVCIPATGTLFSATSTCTCIHTGECNEIIIAKGCTNVHFCSSAVLGTGYHKCHEPAFCSTSHAQNSKCPVSDVTRIVKCYSWNSESSHSIGQTSYSWSSNCRCNVTRVLDADNWLLVEQLTGVISEMIPFSNTAIKRTDSLDNNILITKRFVLCPSMDRRS